MAQKWKEGARESRCDEKPLLVGIISLGLSWATQCIVFACFSSVSILNSSCFRKLPFAGKVYPQNGEHLLINSVGRPSDKHSHCICLSRPSWSSVMPIG